MLLRRLAGLYRKKGFVGASIQIIRHIKNKRLSVWNRFRNREILFPFKYDDVSINEVWKVDRDDVGRSLSMKVRDGKLFIKSLNGERHLNLICGGSRRDLRALTRGIGIKVDGGGRLDLEFDVKSRGVQIKLILVEYNVNHQRIAATGFPPNKKSHLILQPESKYFLVAIRIQGKGMAAISNVAINGSIGGVELEGKRKIDNIDFNQSARSEASYLLHDFLVDISKDIPQSNGSRHLTPVPYRIGIVTDEYMYNFYKDAFEECFYLSPDAAYRLGDYKIDAFLYVSCWSGLEKDEWRGVAYREKPKKALEEIITFCKKNKIKTIFQTIEDPSNFDHFFWLAEKFDVVFTSDSVCVDKYKKKLGHDRVYYAEYGVNPLIHNPIGCRRNKINAFFFAGSWAPRYIERCEDMSLIFDSIMESGGKLIIADRNFNQRSENYRYPAQYDSFVIPPINHELLQSTHKLFRYNLNFNSIKSSPTMCAMRVYELQAMGVNLISNYARSVMSKFPEVTIIAGRQDMGVYSMPPSNDRMIEEYEISMNSLRNVMTRNTNIDIASSILEKSGMPCPLAESTNIAVISENDDLPNEVLNQEGVNVIGLTHSHVVDIANWYKVAAEEEIKYFTFYRQGDRWGKSYLLDMLNGFKYTDSDYITRSAWYDGDKFNEGPQHEYVDVMPGKGRTLFSANIFEPSDFVGLGYKDPLYLQNGYSIDPFQLNYPVIQAAVRQNMPNHGDPLLSVIVPVYNNGRFLYNKAIASLKRNNCWNKIEVILVDDCSNDSDTLYIEDELVERYPNIRLYRMTGEPSGSASKPRNVGLELASSSLISFLDPDNEISNYGYDNLLSLWDDALSKDKKIDFISGYHLKVGASSSPVGKISSTPLKIISDLKGEFFAKGKFPVIPTQPAIISRDLFKKKNLRFVENATGQDTLFGWELLCRARVGGFTNQTYLVYYSERPGSVTNKVDRTYFEKQLILEKAQVSMLKRNNIYEEYKKYKLEDFMSSWYGSKLLEVDDEFEYKVCSELVDEIYSLYS